MVITCSIPLEDFLYISRNKRKRKSKDVIGSLQRREGSRDERGKS